MTFYEKNSAKIKLCFTMALFGTVGLVRRYIDLPSGFVAMIRAILGALFLIAVMLISEKKLDFSSLKGNLIKLIVSGVCLGANWVFLFESYNRTTVATATLCYYMAPVFLVLVSPFIFGERLELKSGISVIISVIGILLVSGVFEKQNNKSGKSGIIFGLLAAVFYTAVMAISKSVTGAKPLQKTVIQMLSAFAVILPYTVFAETVNKPAFSVTAVILLLVLGAVHTGFCYALYFSNTEKVSASALAVLSYIDPAVAVVLSAVVLKEPISALGIVGAVLIIGSAATLE